MIVVPRCGKEAVYGNYYPRVCANSRPPCNQDITNFKGDGQDNFFGVACFINIYFVFYREVYVDPETDVPYDIVMSKVDVKYGMFGLNNFYKMQVWSF